MTDAADVPPSSGASAPRERLLIADDERPIRRFVRLALESHRFRVVEAGSVREALAQVSTYAPALVLLDLGLPDGDGFDVIARVRAFSTMPIIVVSARGAEETKVRALDAGANDFLQKPFGLPELLARVRVALRRSAQRASGAAMPAVVRIGHDILVDLATRTVTKSGHDVHLTPIEYELLRVLVKHAEYVVTHRQLLEQVWGAAHGERVGYLRVYMTQLRAKLEDIPAQPKHLRTELGVGYRLKLGG